MTSNQQPDAPASTLVEIFRRTAAQVPAYRSLLEERGVDPGQVADLDSFLRLAPLLDKENTFLRFPLDQLCRPAALEDLAGVLTSSGHGGSFAYGLITRQQQAVAPMMIDGALQEIFAVDTWRTLVINCLPMGVTFSSGSTTVATVSVREDMAVALVKTFAPYYQQVLLVGDPLFLKRLTDHAREQGVDWQGRRLGMVIGEETFGEHYRNYLAACLGLDPDQGERGQLLSSMGVGELGLHLFFEQPATVALRRAAWRQPAFHQALFGQSVQQGPTPLLFAHHPWRIFVEIPQTDQDGYGPLTISLLDPEAALPLLRYQTGDEGRLLTRDEVMAACRNHGVAPPDGLPEVLLALRGRSKDRLPNGCHVDQYKDALYRDGQLARHLTGAFRLEFTHGQARLHVQLVRDRQPAAEWQQALLAALPSHLLPVELELWEYHRFPFGMGLDYERKFTYYVPDRPSARRPGPPG